MDLMKPHLTTFNLALLDVRLLDVRLLDVRLLDVRLLGKSLDHVLGASALFITP